MKAKVHTYLSSEKTSKKLIPDAHLEQMQHLSWKEMEEIGEVARNEGVPFHIAYIKWKANDITLTKWFSESH